MNEETACARLVRLVREEIGRGHDLKGAVRRAKIRFPRLVGEVMDQIGSIPSSEPELAELQRQFP